MDETPATSSKTKSATVKPDARRPEQPLPTVNRHVESVKIKSPAALRGRQTATVGAMKTVVEAPKGKEKTETEVQTTQLREKQILRELIDDKDVLMMISSKQPDLMKEILGIITQRF